MRRLLLLGPLALCSCFGQYMPEVRIETSAATQVANTITRAIQTADLDGNGVVEGKAESAALWNSLIAAIMAYVPQPEPTEPST